MHVNTSSARHSFASIAAATFATNVGVAVLSLANVLLTARALGAAGRGELAFLTTVAMLTSALSSLGVEEANGNLAAIEPRSRRALATNSVLLSLLLGLAASGTVAGLVAGFPALAAGSDPSLRWIAYAAIPLLIVQIYFQFLVRADYGFALTNSASLLGPAISVAANGTLVAVGRITVGTALAAWIFGQACGTALLGWYVARRGAGFGKPEARLALRAVGFGVKAHAGRVMKTGNYRLDQWFLGALAGPRELGLYSVAVAWSEAVFYLPEALGMVMRPDVVRASSHEVGRQVARVFRITLVLTVPFVVVLVAAAPILCVTVFGSEFRSAIDDLRMLAPGAFGIVALKLFANALTARRKPMLGNAAIAVAFAATVAFDLLLIPPYGGFGAALASTLAYTAGGAAVAIIFARSLQVRAEALLPRGSDIATLKQSLRSLVPRQAPVEPLAPEPSSGPSGHSSAGPGPSGRG
jgi:O-antigen/teichoic acid export membrane protein